VFHVTCRSGLTDCDALNQYCIVLYCIGGKNQVTRGNIVLWFEARDPVKNQWQQLKPFIKPVITFSEL